MQGYYKYIEREPDEARIDRDLIAEASSVVNHSYRCNVSESSFGWEEFIASSPREAARSYYNDLAPQYKNVGTVFVLAPGENPGVNIPIRVPVSSLKESS